MVWIRTFADLSLVLIIVFSGCIAGVYWLVWYDKGTSISSQISSINNQKTKLSTEVKGLRGKLKNLKEIDVTVNEMGSEFEKFLQFIPNQLTSLKIMNHLNKSARDSGVDLQGIRSHRATRLKKDEFYEKVKINVTVKGFFSQILSFLSKLTGLPEIITVETFVINQLGGSSRKRTGTLDEVQIKMDIFGYRYIDNVIAENKL